MTGNIINHCVSCGACCSYYRVSFYWGECDSAEGGIVPSVLTDKLDYFRVTMKGTDSVRPRCIALEGVIGKAVRCEIYPLRPTPCREFQMSWEDGMRNADCDKARAFWGLPPIDNPIKKKRKPHKRGA